MDATPHDIIKYRMKPLPPLRASVVLWSMFLMAAFVVVVLNIYYRLLVPLAEHAHGQTPISSFHSSGCVRMNSSSAGCTSGS